MDEVEVADLPRNSFRNNMVIVYIGSKKDKGKVKKL